MCVGVLGSVSILSVDVMMGLVLGCDVEPACGVDVIVIWLLCCHIELTCIVDVMMILISGFSKRSGTRIKTILR